MKKILFLTLAVSLLFASCGKDDPKPEDPKSTDAEILSFIVNDVNGTIEGTNILLVLDESTDLTNLTPTISLSENATINPESGVAQDFTSPVVYTVTAEDGETKKTYTVSALKVSAGIGTITNRWSKNSTDVGWELHAHAEPCIAIWGNYLAMVQQNSYGSTEQKIRLFNKNTGDVVTDKTVSIVDANTNTVAGGPGLTSDDDKSTLISCNLAGVGADFSIWKWTSADALPVKLLTWTNDVDKSFAIAKASWADAWVGRKLTVAGDLEGNAFIYATPSFSDVVLRWEVSQGAIVSETPEKLFITGMPNTNWEVICGVDALDNTANSKLIVSGVLCGTMLVGSDEAVEWSISRAFGENTVGYFNFNDNPYFGTIQCDAYAGSAATDNNVIGAWIDVFNLDSTALNPSGYWPESFKQMTTNFSPVLDKLGALSYQNNVNVTADFDWEAEVSENGVRTMRIYILGTNCGVSAYEISNLAADK